MDKFNMSSNNKTINENFRGGDFASSVNALQNRPYHKTTSFYKYTFGYPHVELLRIENIVSMVNINKIISKF